MSTKLLRRALCGLVAIVAPLGLPVNAAPPVVKTVPWVANNPLVPHSTYSGKTVTLKGTCDRAGANIQFSWDFGDGSAPVTGTVSDAYVVQATHAYTAPDNTLFTARLTIQDTSTGETGSRTYLVEVMPKTLDVEANIAIDEGLWYLHKAQTRYASGDIEMGHWNTGKYGSYANRNNSSLHAANVNALL
nr:PKD domain-containing protein [Akkermansiaceae bacterium]